MPGVTSDGDYIANAGATLEFQANISSVGASGRVGGAGPIDINGLNLDDGGGVDARPGRAQHPGFLGLKGTSPVTLPALNITGGTLDTDRPITADELNVTPARSRATSR